MNKLRLVAAVWMLVVFATAFLGLAVAIVNLITGNYHFPYF